MSEELIDLKTKILNVCTDDNLVSFIVFGSTALSAENPNDLDAIVVVKKVDSTLLNLFGILKESYAKLDVNIYTVEEVKNNISFYTREFKLEYLSKGVCLFGDNIFIEQFNKVTNFQYKQSILIRSIEHLQLVRQKYLTSTLNEDQKTKFLKKYFLRISKNILLFKGVFSHSDVNRLAEGEIYNKLIELKLFDAIPQLDIEVSLFDEFRQISKALACCKQELNSLKQL